MFQWVQVLRAIRAVRAAIQAKDLEALAESAHGLAELVGYGPEADQVIRVVEAAAAKNWAGLLLAVADLLVLAAKLFFGVGLPVFATGTGPDPVGFALSRAENAPAGETVAVSAEAHAAGLAALELAAFCRTAG